MEPSAEDLIGRSGAEVDLRHPLRWLLTHVLAGEAKHLGPGSKVVLDLRQGDTPRRRPLPEC